MNKRFRRSFGLWVIGCYLVLLVVAVRVSMGGEPVPSAAGWPAPEEFDSLRHYLVPVAPGAAIDDYEAYLPARAPVVGEATAAPAAPAPRVEYRLSAILITGAEPVAIINDEPVRQGARIAGGAQVVAIEGDRVVIREAGGAQRRLRLNEENQELDGE